MMRIALLIALIPLLNACDSIPDAALTSTTRGMFLVSGVEPAVGAAGSVVKVLGNGFDASLKVLSPSGVVVQVSALSSTEFRFTVPSDAKGIVEFTLSQGDGKVQLPFIASGNDATPLLVGSGKGLCKQQQYLTLTGETMNGEIDCAVSDTMQASLLETVTLKDCGSDGQSGCLTNALFPSVDKASLSYRVAPGKSVAGVLGAIVDTSECPR